MFKSIPISSITINREARQRRTLKEVEELAASIAEVGRLINPITVTEDHILIAGERRLEACRSLGWSHITVQFIEDLPEAERQLIELEENVKRVELDWRDRVRSTAAIHALLCERDPKWNQSATAKRLSMSHQNIGYDLDIAESLDAGDPLICKADQYSTARNIVARRKQRQAADELASIDLDEPEAPASAPAPAAPKKAKPTPIECADFCEWAPAYTGPKFNFIHCDFPYGIDADKMDQGGAQEYGGYDDSFSTYERLCNTLHSFMDNGVSESAHLMFWFSMRHYEWTRLRLEAMGWKVLHNPLVWFKDNNRGVLPDPNRGPRWVYETAFLASRGDRHIVESVSNVIPAPNFKEHHMSEKPIPVLRHFFRMFVDGTTQMLDPTCGAGSSIRSADTMGALRVVGLEINEDYAETAARLWRETR